MEWTMTNFWQIILLVILVMLLGTFVYLAMTMDNGKLDISVTLELTKLEFKSVIDKTGKT